MAHANQRPIEVHLASGLAFIALPPGAYGCVLGAAGSGKSALLAAVAASHSGAVTLPSPSPLASWRRLGTALLRATTAPQPQHSASALLEEFALDPTVRLRTLTPQNRLRARLALALAA